MRSRDDDSHSWNAESLVRVRLGESNFRRSTPLLTARGPIRGPPARESAVVSAGALAAVLLNQSLAELRKTTATIAA